MNQDEFSRSIEQVGWTPMQDKRLLEMTVEAFGRTGIFSDWVKEKSAEKVVTGWERIADHFNSHFNPHGSYYYMKAPSQLCRRAAYLKKKAEKAKFKLAGSPLERLLTFLFKENRVTFPSFMTEYGDEVKTPVKTPSFRSPIRTTPGSSRRSSGRYEPYPMHPYPAPLSWI